MLKFFLKLLVLTMVLLSIKIALWAYLQTYKMERFDESSYKLDSILRPIQHQINTVFVGSSRTAHGINPTIFDSVTHDQTRSFNHGISAIFAPNTFAECEKLLKMDGLHLKTIFLELSFPPNITHEDPFSREYLFREFNFKNSHFWREDKMDQKQVQTVTELYDSYLKHFFMLRSSIYPFVLTGVRNERPNFIMTSNGFRYFRPNRFPANKKSEKIPPDTAAIPMLVTEKEQFYVSRLMQLARKCEEKNVAIYFYLPNVLMKQERQFLPNVYAALPDQYRIAVPYQRAYTFPFPASASDDQRHLNYKAATLYTQSFARAFLKKVPVVATR